MLLLFFLYTLYKVSVIKIGEQWCKWNVSRYMVCDANINNETSVKQMTEISFWLCWAVFDQ